MIIFLLTGKNNHKICDPWEAKVFNNILEDYAYKNCSYCLPNCNTINYDLFTQSINLEKCDDPLARSTSYFCRLESELKDFHISIWPSIIQNIYNKGGKVAPDYIKVRVYHGFELGIQ